MGLVYLVALALVVSPAAGVWTVQRFFAGAGCTGAVGFINFVPSTCTVGLGSCNGGAGGSQRVDCEAQMPSLPATVDTSVTFSSTNACADVTGVYAGIAGLCIPTSASASLQFTCPGSQATLTSFSASAACSGAGFAFGRGPGCGPVTGQNASAVGACNINTTATTAPTVPPAVSSALLILGFSALPSSSQNTQIIGFMAQLTSLPTSDFSVVSTTTRAPSVTYNVAGPNAGAAANLVVATVKADPNYFTTRSASLPSVTSARAVASAAALLSLASSAVIVAALLLLLV
jgi:hypothetical protein